VRLPINAWRSRFPRALIDGLDQRAADSLSARRFICEKVGQIAYRFNLSRTAMKKKVCESQKLPIFFSDNRVDRIVRGEKTRPCCIRYFFRQRWTSVKKIVALPKRQPLIKIRGIDRANDE
jgi:hypothetical protein